MQERTKGFNKRDSRSVAAAEPKPMLQIEVVELADPGEGTGDVVFYRSTCTTCSTS